MAITVTCPNCKHDFSVDEVLSHKLSEQIESDLKKEFNLKWVEQKEKLAAEAKKEVSESLELRLKELQEENDKKSKEVSELREQEITLRKKTAELQEMEQKLKLESQRKLDEERKKIAEEALVKASEEQKFLMAEKDKQLDDMKKKIDELQLKSQLTSQQLQGEVQELELEDLLRVNFPLDSIEPVGKGVNGADVVQRVYDNTGKMCGAIVWESKRTKNWTEGWVQKLVGDLRAVKGDVAILVSSVLPDSVKKFGPYEKIYVTGFENCLEVAKMVRLKIIELCYAKSAASGKNDKKEILWTYLTGNEFKSRVEAMVEVFSVMRDDLEKEKMYFTKKWAKEEKMIGRMTENLIGMHGDIQGLIGTSLPEIESTQMLTLDLIDMSDEVIS